MAIAAQCSLIICRLIWGHLVGSDDHDMAMAILLTKVTTDTVGDKIRIHDKQHGRLGELSFRHDPYTKVRPKTQ